ncbi:MAG TPA: TlpA disulfide reductase family protein [Lacipirellulaceae bacterium]|jgi:peroxiredoxin|nr:TlpA disulfide reductase family protein [Lacipirellulaceae bacterium]
MHRLRQIRQFAIRRTFLCLFAAVLLAIGPSTARASREDDFKKLQSEYETAAQKFIATHRKADPSDADLIRNFEELPLWRFLPRYLALAEAEPTDATALECCNWVLTESGDHTGDKVVLPAEQKVWNIIAANPAAADELPQLSLQAAQSPSPVREQFLRNLLKKSTLTEQQASYVNLALAELIARRINLSDELRKRHETGFGDGVDKHLESRFAPEYANYLTEIDRKAAKEEAKGLYHTVIDQYGSVPKVSPMRLSAAEFAKQSLYALEHLDIGDVAPAIVGEDISGHPLKLEDYRGRVVVLSFWFSACEPCMEMVPDERELNEKFKNRPFTLLGICGDSNRDQAKKTIAREKIIWPCLFDGGQEGPVARAYNVSKWPTFYLIDPTGRIVDKDMNLDHLADIVANQLDKSGKKK